MNLEDKTGTRIFAGHDLPAQIGKPLRSTEWAGSPYAIVPPVPLCILLCRTISKTAVSMVKWLVPITHSESGLKNSRPA
jgi:hypothetical protein